MFARSVIWLDMLLHSVLQRHLLLHNYFTLIRQIYSLGKHCASLLVALLEKPTAWRVWDRERHYENFGNRKECFEACGALSMLKKKVLVKTRRSG